MAILRRSALLLLLAAALLLLGFLSAPTASARPCKTLFITFSIEPVRFHRHPNPNNFIFIDSHQNPADGRSVAIFSDEMTKPEFSSSDGLFFIDRPDFPAFKFDRPRGVDEEEETASFLRMLSRGGIDFDSVMDRSKDVLSVVVALLFGVGCGALTAATMYFVWMLVVGHREEDDYEEEEKERFYSEYDEIPSPQKGEYVKIPEAAAPAQAKEVV